MEKKPEQNKTTEELKAEIKKLNLDLKKANRQIKRLEQERDYIAALNEQAYKMRDFYESEYKQQYMYSSLILNSSPDILFIMNNDFKILRVTSSFLKMFQLTEADIENGIFFDDILRGKISQENLDELKNRYQGLQADLDKYEKQVMINILEEEHTFETHIIMIHQENFAGYVIAMSDVTEMVRARDRAESADRAKSEFLANMSHEIRTPMNAITGMAEFIIRDTTDEEARKNAQQIKNACRSLLVIINDILDFSKIEAGKMELIPVEYQISSVINDVANMTNIRLQGKPVELVLDIDETMPYLLYGDEIRLRQILMNLLNNSAKFTKNGSICLKMWYEKDRLSDEIKIYASVQDSGIGIKEENLKKLFSSFNQVDTKKNRAIEGTGLGLAISKKLATMMHGDITVESTYGVGTTFTVCVRHRLLDEKPIGNLAMENAVKEQKAFSNSFTAPSAKILIVDDNLINLNVAQGMLKPYKCNLTLATGGQEAVDISRTEAFDIIFMDHMMPVKDGVDAMREIRSLPGRKDSVIIALTANAISGVREKYKQYGFQDFLAKPIEPEKLEEQLDKYLPNQMKAASDGTATISLIDDEILKQVYHEGLKKLDLMRHLIDEKDYKNYTIEVHALKSVAAIIGETLLSEQAKQHETAGREGNTSFIEDDFESLLENYGELVARLGKRFAWDREENHENQKEIIEISEEAKQELFDKLKDAVDEFDMMTVNEILLQLCRVELGERQEIVEKMKKSAEEFDYDGLEQLILQF